MAATKTTFVILVPVKFRAPPLVPPTRIQERKHGCYSIRSTLDRIQIGLAIAHRWQIIAKQRWQMISKPPALLFQRVGSRTAMALSDCYTSLESLLKAKWQRMRPPKTPAISTHVYEIRPRADHDGVDLISDALRFGSLWYSGPNGVSNAIGFAKFFSRSHDALIRVYDEAGNVIETHQQAGSSKRRDVSPQGNKRNHELVNVCRGVSAQ